MTLTIIARNPYTRHVGVAIASGSDDCARGSLHVIADKAIISVQAKSDKATAARAVDLFNRGVGAQDILDMLKKEDSALDLRQILIAPLDGDMAIFTGAQCLHWAGHIEREHLLLAGNMLSSDKTLAAMEKAYLKDMHAPMRKRLLAALYAGVETGGDVRGHKSAGITIIGDQAFDCRVTHTDAPLEKLSASILAA